MVVLFVVFVLMLCNVDWVIMVVVGVLLVVVNGWGECVVGLV